MKYRTILNQWAKKGLLAVALMVVAATGLAQRDNEYAVNSEYREIIINSIRADVAQRQQLMQQQAEALLQELPNDRRLYNDSEVSIKARVASGDGASGRSELNYVIEISYNCKSLEGGSDDYVSGSYLLENSNSAMALCQIAQQVVAGVNDDLFAQGNQVTIRIASSADALSFKHLAYHGEYGDHRYAPAVFNGEPVRLSLMQNEGIATNAQLAFARAQGVRHYLQTNMEPLQRTLNEFFIITRCADEAGAYHRRISIEFTIHSAFNPTIIRMNEELTNDNFIEYNIPLNAAALNANTYVIIIANENYDAPLPNCDYAWRDGAVFRDYCVRTLSVPERQIKMLTNASRAAIKREGVEWVANAMRAVGGNGRVIVYYAGHGASDPEYNAVLIPCGMDPYAVKSWVGKTEIDAISQMNRHDTKALFDQCISLDTLCGWLSQVPADQMTLMLDASFNNTTRNGEPMFNIKRTVERVKGLRLRSDIVIFCAADVQHTAFTFDEMHHGFLTYYMLKEIKRTKGNITLGDLYRSLQKEVAYESSLQGKLQEPQIIAGGKIKDSWTSLRLK